MLFASPSLLTLVQSPLVSFQGRLANTVLNFDVALLSHFHIGVPQDALNVHIFHAKSVQIRRKPSPKSMPSAPRDRASFIQFKSVRFL
jgi:hypothetical protein